MEGVLVPEIWIAFAEESGIPELRRTTRDEPDYDKLMRWRIDLLRQRGLDAAVGAGGGCQVRIDRQGSVCCRGQVITCGLDRRATVTASSLLQRGGMAALQREMRTLDGRLLQPRELSLEGLPGTMTQRITGAGLLLLLGEEPE